MSEEEKNKYIENINHYLDNLIDICYEKSNMQDMTATGIKIIKQPIFLIFDDLLNKIERLKNLNEHQSKEIDRLNKLLITKTAKSINESLNSNKKHNEELEDLNEGWKKEIEIKDKMIDEIAEMFLTIAKDIPGTIYHYLEKDGFSLQQCLPCHKQEKDKNWTCAECFKEYFKRKAEDNK